MVNTFSTFSVETGLPTRWLGTGTRTRNNSPPPRLSRTSLPVCSSISWNCFTPHVVVATVGMFSCS